MVKIPVVQSAPFNKEDSMVNGVVRSAVCLAALFMVIGCGTKVTRVGADSTIDLSGRWNDADSRLVADDMIKDCLAQSWLGKWQAMNKQPTVIVGKVVNKSHEHISTETFAEDIERALLNSGKVGFVAGKAERDQVRDEKADQQDNAASQSVKSLHEETGADLMLIGDVNSIVDQEDNKAVVFYQISMKLIEIESNRTVWIGEKKIKKYIERSEAKF
jgi:uncharacterized protein (TIGR02722 family)